MGTIASPVPAPASETNDRGAPPRNGHTVLGVDLKGAEIEADLGTPEGRATAIAEDDQAQRGSLQGLGACAGVAGMPDRAASLLVSINYFGTVELLEGLRPLLAAGTPSAAVAISSNSTTTQPGYSLELVDALLAGDEGAARELADRGKGGSVNAYPAVQDGGRPVGAPPRGDPRVGWQRHHPERRRSGNDRHPADRRGSQPTPMIEQRLEMFEGTIAVGRPGKPEEIAGLIAYLLGPEARFFCGSIIYCDGGTDACSGPTTGPPSGSPRAEPTPTAPVHRRGPGQCRPGPRRRQSSPVRRQS